MQQPWRHTFALHVLQSGHGSRHMLGEWCCSCRAKRYLLPAMRRPLGTHLHVHGATTYCYLPISNAALMIAEQPRSSSFQALDAARKAIYRITTTVTMVCQAAGRARVLFPCPPRNGDCCTDGNSPEVGHRFPHHGTASGATSDKNVMPGLQMKPRISRHELPSSLATTEDAWSRNCARD